MKNIIVQVGEQFHAHLKTIAAQRGVPMKAIVLQALAEYLKKESSSY